MRVILNTNYASHNGAGEVHHGELVPCFENPTRIDSILQTFKAYGVTEYQTPEDFGLEPILAVHDSDYVDFLQHIWQEWQAAGNTVDLIPYIWSASGLPANHNHPSLNARAGTYAFSSDSPITAGTWESTYWAAQSALTALQQVNQGQRAAFSLSRPPGHHAHAGLYGGYCYLNSTAIAAQAALTQGASKVCVLDVDYHHGNGTQDIFYPRSDVLTVSLHGHPDTNFPYFLGYDTEIGTGDGEGYNINIPLPDGTAFSTWSKQLHDISDRIHAFGADVLIVALGVDTFEGDPISKFTFTTADYLTMGQQIAAFNLPTVFIMEGGYDVGPIGENVYNVLAGFELAK
ncbi:histone deacetylase family protein [Marinomonas agarivorans]|nr:histone deacetylase family protein [Marinomonas agarivorans]